MHVLSYLTLAQSFCIITDNVEFDKCLFSVSDFVEANMLYWDTPAGVGFSYSTNSSKTKMNDVLTGFEFTFLLFFFIRSASVIPQVEHEQ